MQVEYSNSTRLLAVIGDPVAHSLSPLLQNTMIRALDRDDLYVAVRVEKGGLPAFLDAAKTLAFRGFNLTMPHKVDVIPFLSAMTPEARKAGSVNSVRLRDGRWEGHSTDGLGFRRALEDRNWTFEDQVVTILGAGGAARSIAMTAADSGAKKVLVVNRTLEKAQALCAEDPVLEAVALEDAEDAAAQTDLLINTTPVGMEGTGQTGSFPFLAALKPDAPAADCVYAPPVTPFMAAAEALGHPTMNGLGMLIYQAIYAYAFFREETFDGDRVTALGALLRRTLEGGSGNA